MPQLQYNRQLAYLDTNALHYLSLWLSKARERDLYPFPIDGPGTIEAAVAVAEAVPEKVLSESLLKGLWTIFFLVDDQMDMHYAMISRLELTKGRALGRAIQKLATSGVPDRMWGKVGEGEVNRLITVQDLQNIQARIGELFSVLSDLGVYHDSRLGAQRDILDLAQSIMGVVYLDVADSIIYAGAIDARADYVIADDGAFMYTINKIHNPSADPSWELAQQELISRISRVRLWDIDSISLPLGLKCKKSRFSVQSPTHS